MSGLGAAISGRVRAEGALFTWLGCVAYAMLAGLVARIVVMPLGTLEATALGQRRGDRARRLFPDDAQEPVRRGHRRRRGDHRALPDLGVRPLWITSIGAGSRQ
jgi:hypothetical protein